MTLLRCSSRLKTTDCHGPEIYFVVRIVWFRVKQRTYPQDLPRLFLEQESELKFRQGYWGNDGC